MKCVRAWAPLGVGGGGVTAGLPRVVAHLGVDPVRGSQSLPVVEDVPGQAEAPQQQRALEDKECPRRVDRALKQLPERQRLALTLFHYEGMSQLEIGSVMEISDEAVESLLGRARRQLKADLKTEWQAMLVKDGPEEFGGV